VRWGFTAGAAIAGQMTIGGTAVSTATAPNLTERHGGMIEVLGDLWALAWRVALGMALLALNGYFWAVGLIHAGLLPCRIP